MSRFIFCILFLCFGFCSLVMGAERLLVTLKEQEDMSQRVIDLQIANWSSIRTWQGRAIVVSTTTKKGENTDVTSGELRYEVDFAFDVVSGNKAWDSRFSAGNRAHSRENSFVRDETSHHLITGRSKDGGSGFRLLYIFPVSQSFVKQFDPFEKSLPSSLYAIKFRFSMSILELCMADRREREEFSEEENEAFRKDVIANGFNDYRFRLDGNMFTREWFRSEHLREVFVVNLDQCGSIVAYKSFRGVIPFLKLDPDQMVRGWEATYQKIGNVWLPQKTKFIRSFDDGSTSVEEIEWLDQKINQKIPEERFTLKGIGAFQGIEIIDYRTGDTYRATGDEYPPEYEIQKRPKSYFPSILIGIGLVIILFALARLIYNMLIIKTGAKQ